MVGVVAAIVILAGSCIGIARLRTPSQATAIIRVELPTLDGWATTEPDIFLRLLNAGRDLARDPTFRNNLSNDALVPEGAMGKVRLNQYRCTSLIDVSFAASRRDLADRLVRHGSIALFRNWATNFPGLRFEILQVKTEQ
jgi:hypothetical protein